MKNTSGEAVSDATQNTGYAGFWVRVAAYFLDYAIIMVGSLVISIGLVSMGDVAGVIGGFVLLLVTLLYYPVMESSARQATFGKSLAGIKVTDLDGKRLSFGRALLRTIAKILSAIPFCIGFLLAAFTARKQALHDMLAKTLVVRTGPSHLLKLFVIAVSGLAILIGGSGAYLYYVYLPQVKNEMAGAMSEAMKGAATVPSVPSAPPVARKAVPLPGIASPSTAPAASGSTSVADEPEAVYAKFHRAGLTANFDEMIKYGTAQPDLVSMPASERQAMLDFLAKLLPKIYTVIRKTIDPDGKHATLHLDASGAAGTITMIKENGIWKVGNADWGGSSQAGEASPKAAMAAVVAAKRQFPVSEGKDQSRTTEDRKLAVATLQERSLQASRVPLEKMITPKFNDVMTAVLRQDQAGVTELLDLGWWVDKQGSNGFTPLMEAVAMGDAPMAELLLKRGANQNAAARDGSVLQIAKRNQDTAMIELLRRYGATVE